MHQTPFSRLPLSDNSMFGAVIHTMLETMTAQQVATALKKALPFIQKIADEDTAKHN